MQNLKQHFFPETRFGGFSDIDGTITFYTRVHSLLEPSHTVLDVGCGTGENWRSAASPYKKDLLTLKGKCQRCIGLDVDPGAADNPLLDEFRLLESDRWPVDDASIDLCLADFVLEHVENPQAFFSEAGRVVRPGGYICMRVPNLYSYFGIISRLVPDRMHGKVKRAVGNKPHEDAYPTFYRCNSVGRIRKALNTAGFTDHCVYGFESEPSYLGFSSIAYRLGLLHNRLVPKRFRTCIFVFARKPEAPQ